MPQTRSSILLVLVTCLLALPAAAEGGGLPSMGVLIMLGLAYLLLAPLMVTVDVHWIIRLMRRPVSIRLKAIVIAALASWIVASIVLLNNAIPINLSERKAILVSVSVTFIFTLVVAVWRTRARPAGRA